MRANENQSTSGERDAVTLLGWCCHQLSGQLSRRVLPSAAADKAADDVLS